MLQREQKSSAPALTILAYGVVVAIALGLLVLLAWGLHRLATSVRPGTEERFGEREKPTRSSLQPAGGPA